MRHYFGLDILRFLAAIMVVGYHFGEFGTAGPVFPADPLDLAWPWLSGVTNWGWVGVQIFFVISGFVIAASARGSTAGGFLIRRAVRVFPALWVYSCIALLIRLFWGEPVTDILPAFLRSVVLFPEGPYIDGIVWTLVVEAVFYGFIALLISCGGGQPQSKLLERGACLLGGASAVFLCVSILSKHIPLFGGDGDAGSFLGRYFFSVLLLRHGVFFALGMLVWRGHATGLSALARRALVIFAIMGGVQIAQTCLESGSPVLLTVMIWAGTLLTAYGSLHLWRQDCSPRRAAVLREIGLLTYPVYLGHFTVGLYLTPALSPYIENRLLLLTVMVVIVFSLAWMVLRGPEQALQALAKRKLLKHPLAVPADLAAK